MTVNIDGGADIDGVDFSSLTAGVTVHLDTGTYSSGNVSGSITGVEDVNGSIFADDMTGGVNSETLVGNDGGDTLRGGGGSDYIDGGAGDDTLYGDAGQDNLVGGEGNDILVFEDDMTAGSMNGGVGEDTVRFVGSVTNFDFVASPVNPFTDIEVIDLAVCDPILFLDLSWNVYDDLRGSDHLPVITDFER